ncbi:YncE family protein [Hyphomicrobium sp.]|uniref:YncE family protein n=1 Tax=Hyphomicrobium sp. TaxID=82 RepID=UPI002BC4A89A|nr:YncE family protein [Hyphomicrobium sp.]HRN89596.1 YncE family protein [Hyphomicrobium sp.]HRQ25606.1 YncE family protein [Hyphomicrobium sp.]
MSNVLRGAVAAMLWIASASGVAAERIYILSQEGAVLSEVASGADAPADDANIKLEKGPALLALAPDAPLAYVTHSDLGQVAVVDLDQRRVVRTIDVPGSPFGIAAGKDGRIFVGDWHEDHVIAVDTAGEGEPRLTKVRVGRAPAHVVLSPDGEMVFVANREDDSVSAVRTSDMTVVATIPVGHAPFAMTLSPDGARLFVGNMQGGSVSVVDTGKLAVSDTWKTGAMPYGAAVTPDGGRVLITHQGGGTVGIFADTDTALATVKVGSYPEGVAIGENGTRAYVANWFSDNVSVIDLGTMKEIQRIKTPAGPRAVAVRTAP